MNERLTIPRPAPFTGQPPGIGSEPRLYALLAVEIEPGYIAYYHLELDHFPGACTIEMTRDDDPIYIADQLEPLRYIHTAPMHIDATISGTVVSQEQHYRPPTRTAAHLGDTPALPAAPHD